MEIEEAIAHIKRHREAHAKREPFAYYINEALDLAVAALEKQAPKKPIIKNEKYPAPWDGYFISTEYYCPSCGAGRACIMHDCGFDGNRYKCCCDCGQALDWGTND